MTVKKSTFGQNTNTNSESMDRKEKWKKDLKKLFLAKLAFEKRLGFNYPFLFLQPSPLD